MKRYELIVKSRLKEQKNNNDQEDWLSFQEHDFTRERIVQHLAKFSNCKHRVIIEKLDKANQEITLSFEDVKNVWEPFKQKAIILKEKF